MESIKDTVIQSGVVIGTLASSFALSYVAARCGLGKALAELVLNFTHSPMVFMMMVNIIFIIAGMFVPTEISTFVITPLLIPIVNELGINMVYFGVITSINIILGNVTPPFGFLCFVVSGMMRVDLGKIFKEIIPFVVAMYVILFILTIFPDIVLFIPNMMG